MFSINSRSFKLDKFVGNYLFHISSEGELEQIRSILEEFLNKKLRIELVYTSESVEKKCVLLAETYPHQVRILRLPLLSFFPINFLYFQSIWSWASSPTIIFCRYDFFPELLAFKLLNKKFILLSGATKKINWYKTSCFKLFDYIVAANRFEKKHFQDILKTDIPIDNLDFRIPRIFDRIDNSFAVLSQNRELIKIVNFLKGNPNTRSLIIGSAWESDLDIFYNDHLIKDLSDKRIMILIAPHKLNTEHIIKIENKLKSVIDSSLIEVLNHGGEWHGSPITIITIPAILCELYTLFPISYVGGGFEKSIHSVLEPFLSGSKVICGPKIHRSTEFDFIKSEFENDIVSIHNTESFYDTMLKLNKDPINNDLRELLKLKLLKNKIEIIQKIENI